MTLADLLTEIFDDAETVENMQRAAAANGDAAIFNLPVILMMETNNAIAQRVAVKGFIEKAPDSMRFISILAR